MFFAGILIGRFAVWKIVCCVCSLGDAFFRRGDRSRCSIRLVWGIGVGSDPRGGGSD